MKKTLIVLTLIFISCQLSTAQNIKTTTYSMSRTAISYVSVKKDTLILPNDNLGQLIFSTWYDVPKKQRPIILFADAKTIEAKNESMYDSRKKLTSKK